MLPKKITLLIATLSVLLVGCDSSNQADSLNGSVKAVNAEQTLAASLIPDGHWLFNPRHCLKELPSAGVFDVKVEQSNFTYIGITQIGKWTTLPLGTVKESLNKFFSLRENKCFAPTSDYTPVLARFKAPGTDMTFVVIPGHDKIFRLQGEEIIPAANFDASFLKQFKFIEVQKNDPYAIKG